MIKIICLVLVITIILAFTACGKEDSRQPILIQGQFTEETDLLFAAVEDAELVTVGSAVYHVGTLDGYPVIMVDSQMGLSNAAANTAAAILTFDPYCVINQGTSGGHTEDLYVGDLVLGETIVNTGAFATPYRAEGEGIAPEDWETYNTNLWNTGELVEVFELHSDETLLTIAQGVENVHTDGKVVTGIVGSADFWNREVDRINLLNEIYDTSTEDMEAFAVAVACNMWEVPFLSIRIISNSDITDGAYDLSTGATCQSYTLDVAKAIIAEIS